MNKKPDIYFVKHRDLKEFGRQNPNLVSAIERLFWKWKDLREMTQDGKQRVLIVAQGEKVLGCLIMAILRDEDKAIMMMPYEEKTTELRNIVVNPRLSHFKICRLMILETIKYLKRKALADRLTLDVVRTHVPAVKCYRRNGFHILVDHGANEWINLNYHIKYNLGEEMAYRYRIMVMTSLI